MGGRLFGGTRRSIEIGRSEDSRGKCYVIALIVMARQCMSHPIGGGDRRLRSNWAKAIKRDSIRRDPLKASIAMMRWHIDRRIVDRINGRDVIGRGSIGDIQSGALNCIKVFVNTRTNRGTYIKCCDCDQIWKGKGIWVGRVL